MRLGRLMATLLVVAAACGGQRLVSPVDTARLAFAEGFDDTDFGSRGWYDLPSGGLISISTAEHRPGSAASLQVTFPTGEEQPVPSTVARHLFPPTEAVFLRYWVKHSENWVGSGRSFHPHEFYFLTTEDDAVAGPAWTHLTAYVEENTQADGSHAVLETQDGRNVDTAHIGHDLARSTERRAVSGCNGSPDNTPTDCYSTGAVWDNGKAWRSARPVFLDTPGAGYKAQWHLVQAYFRLNSIVRGVGQRDGVARYWVDGTLVIDRRDLLLRTGAHPSMRFNQLLIGPYMGGGSPVAQTLWIDDLALMIGHSP